ncbi:RcpC/CpaB family pilus assembly protein [Streptomyces sp. NPDC005925]|uniref:RcpC/CpaB family pilus assembly protein n=1 Tax=Streptomyces sp. NPDC005925 TaxID=3157172 RepID=UPI0033C178B9
MPLFAPVRVRGDRFGPSRLVRHRRRAVAAGLAVTAAALVAAGPGGIERARGRPGDPVPPPRATAPPADRPVRTRRTAGFMTAPVRIADAATVRLLRPGDRVDVIATGDDATDGGAARVIARGARVTKVPRALADDPAGSGALVVLSVPPSTAARLAGASATARLAVTLW